MSKRRNVGQIYLPEGFLQIWTKFMEICDREGSSGSEKVRDFVRAYVRRHEPGNPQTRLDTIIERGAPPNQPPRCGFCDRPAAYICHIRKSQFASAQAVYACDDHRRRLAVENPFFGYREL